MCRSSTPLLLVLLVALAGAAVRPVAGQTVEDYRARIDRLSRMMEEAEREERQEEEWLRAQVDTIRVGTLSVLTRREHAARVGEAVSRAWRMIQDGLGADAYLVGEQRYFLAPKLAVDATRLFWEEMPVVQYPEGEEADRLAARLVGQIGDRLAERLDPGRGWLLTFRFGRMEREERERVYVNVVVTRSAAVRSCLDGDNEACRVALELVDLQEPLVAWYNAEQRRNLVEYYLRRGRGRSALWTDADFNEVGGRCVEGGSDDACLEYLKMAGLMLRPLSFSARLLMVEVARDLGGEGARRRLLSPATDLDIAERLTSAAGVDADSLVAVWRAAVLASRPKAAELPRSVGWPAFFWIAALGFLSAWSTRWRSS
jgi:hypothetical protein